jgi:CRP/FNR family transcriptional regulator, cyclic AMP receptor protein
MSLNLFNYDDPRADVVGAEGRILSDLTDAEWDNFLALMERRTFPKGAQILTAGERDRTLYLIASGEVEVAVDAPAGRKRLATIGEGSVFGEMSFFDGAPRSAHVFAETEVEVLALHQDRFGQLAAWHPRIAHKLLMDLGRVLSLRIRRLNLTA